MKTEHSHTTSNIVINHQVVADPGFSRGAGAPTLKIGIILHFFCQKLHENERIATPGREGGVPGAPLYAPMLSDPNGQQGKFYRCHTKITTTKLHF